jgi:hypothetical protein
MFGCFLELLRPYVGDVHERFGFRSSGRHTSRVD